MSLLSSKAILSSGTPTAAFPTHPALRLIPGFVRQAIWVTLAMTLFTTGCGGAGNRTATGATTSSASKVFIAWPASTAIPQWPANPLSAIITFHAPDGVGNSSSRTINRPSPTDTSFQSYALSLNPGLQVLNVDYYSGKDGSGSLVGSAAATVTVNQSGAIIDRFGFPFEGVGTGGNISWISVPTGFSVHLAQTTRLVIEAYDESDGCVALPSNVTWTSTDNPQIVSVSSNGYATGQLLGQAFLRLDLPNQSPSYVYVPVSPSPSSQYATPNRPMSRMTLNPVDGRLYGVTFDGNFIQAYDLNSGASQISTVGVGSGIVAVSGDGRALFVSEAPSGLQPFAVPSLLPLNAIDTGAYQESNLIGILGESNSFFAVLAPNTFGAPYAGVVFDGATTRHATCTLPGGINGNAVYDPASSAVYISTTSGKLARCAIDASGVQPPVPLSPATSDTPLQICGGTLFTFEGDEISLAAGQVTGQLPGHNAQLSPLAINQAGTLAYLTAAPNTGTQAQVTTIYVASITNNRVLGSFVIPIANAQSIESVVAIGNASLALTFAVTEKPFHETIVVKNTMLNLTP